MPSPPLKKVRLSSSGLPTPAGTRGADRDAAAVVPRDAVARARRRAAGADAAELRGIGMEQDAGAAVAPVDRARRIGADVAVLHRRAAAAGDVDPVASEAIDHE